MTYLTGPLQSFFTDYVHTQRNLADNTIAAYRDTWRLLIKHVCITTATSADQIRLEDIDHAMITAFLDHLTNERANTAATRNARLDSARSGSSLHTPCPSIQNTPRPSAVSWLSHPPKPPNP